MKNDTTTAETAEGLAMIRRVRTEAWNNVFNHQCEPEVKIELDFGGREPHGLVVARLADLLTEEISTRHIAARGETVSFKPQLPCYGIFRMEFAWVENEGDAPHAGGTVRRGWDIEDEGTKGEPGWVRIFVGYGPAVWARELPDDFPIALHAVDGVPPLPGFKWYRYFTHWSDNNPAKGEYNWKAFDAMFERMKAIGGRLLIADDTTPEWCCAPERRDGVPWVPGGTAYPPDDPNDLRVYLDEMRKRYDDASGTLAGLAVWNEANTSDRWKGTPKQMVELAAIFREVADHYDTPVKVCGVDVSAGPHAQFIMDLVDAGMLEHCDVIGGHWYEEMHSYEYESLPSNLPHHVAILKHPMQRAGYNLEIWNTESGIDSPNREDGRLVHQNELNSRAEQRPAYNPQRAWLFDNDTHHWRHASEQRAAAEFVAGVVMLLGEGVSMTCAYTFEGWRRDGCTSLQWVSLSCLGHLLCRLDYHQVRSVEATAPGGGDDIRGLAYRLGDPAGPNVTVAWGYISDTKIGRSKLWQRWLDPVPMRVAVASDAVVVRDLYLRTSNKIKAVDGYVEIEVGEEPVYIQPA